MTRRVTKPRERDLKKVMAGRARQANVRPKGTHQARVEPSLPEHPMSTSQAAITSLLLPSMPPQLDLNTWPNVARGKWHPSIAPAAYRLLLLGLTEEELAAHLGIDLRTLSRWKEQYPEFRTACLLAGDAADTDVVVKLRECAMGYSHPEEKVFCTKDGDIVTYQTIKHYPPNPVAAMMYLSNRQRVRWKNAAQLDHTSSDGLFGMFVLALRQRDQAMEGEFRAIEGMADQDPPSEGPVRQE